MMKTSKVLAVVVAATAVSGSVFGQITTVTVPQTTTGSIPDYSQLGSPLSLSGVVAGLDTSKTWYVYSVSLTLSGDPTGSNGDIYAKLIYGNQASAILLNQAGSGTSYSNPVIGYQNNGLQFTFMNDQFATGITSTDAHAYQTSPQYSFDAQNKAYGTYLVDGRETITTGTDPRTKLLTAFNGLNPNSTLWGLYLQDFSAQNKLKVDSWAITFTTVPEPSQYAMLAGLGLVGFAAYRRYRVKTA